MVKYASSILLVAAFVTAPVFAQSNWDEFDAREYDELFTRHPEEAGLVSRETEPQASVFERSYDFDTELESRSYDDDDLEAREFDELYERAVEQMEDITPNFFTFMRDGMQQVRRIALEQAAAKHNATTAAPSTPEDPSAPENPSAPEDPNAPAAPDASAAAGEPEAREFDEDAMWERALDEALQERDFSDEDLFERQYNEEIEERNFSDEDLFERQYNEIEERNFDDEDLFERQYNEEIEERYFDDEDLLEREYDEELQEREFDYEAGLYERDYPMSELLERVYFDDLD